MNGPIVSEFSGKPLQATVKVRCELCTSCWLDPRSRNRCIYGGPYSEYILVDSQAKDAKVHLDNTET